MAGTFLQPSSISLSGYSGYYGGATLSVNSHTRYPYIYVSTSSTGKYWYKGTGTTFTVDADTSSTSKTVYVTFSSEDLGSSVDYTSDMATLSFSVPRFAFRCYVTSTTSSQTISGSSGSFSITPGTGSYKGLATASSATTASVTGTSWTSVGATVNGKTYYVISQTASGTSTSRPTLTYYLGTSTKKTTSLTVQTSTPSATYNANKLVSGGGTGTTTITGLPSNPTTHSTDSNYKFTGWSKTTSNYSTVYTGLQDIVEDGTYTVYGVFCYSPTQKTVYYYRGNSTIYNIKSTVAAGYYYGTGSHKAHTESIAEPTKTCLANSSYSFTGWATTTTSKTGTYSTLQAALAAGYTTVYGVYTYTPTKTTVTYYRGTSASNSASNTVTTGYYYGKGTHTDHSSTSIAEPTKTCLANSSYSFTGWATTTTSKTGTYSTLQAAADAGYTTVYGVYTYTPSGKSIKYYLYPSTSAKTITSTPVTGYYYGRGTNSAPSSGTITEPSIPTISGMAFAGWTSNQDYFGHSSVSATVYTNLNSASDSNKTIVYGCYSVSKDHQIFYQNGTGNSETRTVYYGLHGVNQKTVYCGDPPTLSYEGYSFSGWSTDDEGNGQAWNSVFNTIYQNYSSNFTPSPVYAIWVKNGGLYYGFNNKWYPVVIYYGQNIWKQCSVYYGDNGTWRNE